MARDQVSQTVFGDFHISRFCWCALATAMGHANTKVFQWFPIDLRLRHGLSLHPASWARERRTAATACFPKGLQGFAITM